MTCWLIALSLVALPTAPEVDARALGPTELPKTQISYEIDVRVDLERRRLQGQVRLRWANPAPKPVRKMPIHLYLNAFSHTRTTFVDGEPGIGSSPLEDLTKIENDPFGWTRLGKVMRTDGAEPKPVEVSYVQPDDGNPYDRTLAELTFTEPVATGTTVALTLPFEAQLPVAWRRTGGRLGYLHVAQWFPKPGVYDVKKDRWAARQFHGSTEFFADFADWTVTIDAPKAATVIATGELASRKEDGDRVRWQFKQRAVHDFAFMLSPDVHTESQPYQPPGGGPEIALTYVVPKGRENQIAPMREAAEATFRLMAERVGPYPFTTMKVIAPPAYASGSLGMEYPTLVTGFLADPILDIFPRVRFDEQVTSHEIIHNYFQGMVANDEQRNAWLDEGFTSFWTLQVMQVMLTKEENWQSVFGYPASWEEFGRFNVGQSAPNMREAVHRQPANMFYPGTRGDQIYGRTTLTLETAQRLFGAEAIDKVFRTYFARYRFSHPEPEDFFGVVDEVAPPGMAAYIHEAFTAREMPDYEVTRATSKRWRPPTGYVMPPSGGDAKPVRKADREDNPTLGIPPGAEETTGEVTMIVFAPGWREGTDSRHGQMLRRTVTATPAVEAKEDFMREDGVFYRSDVRVRGPGWRNLPVVVEMTFDDGVVIRDEWDGRSAYRAYRFTRPAGLRRVRVDPDDRLVIDANVSNNAREVEPNPALGNTVGRWLGQALQILFVGMVGWL